MAGTLLGGSSWPILLGWLPWGSLREIYGDRFSDDWSMGGGKKKKNGIRYWKHKFPSGQRVTWFLGRPRMAPGCPQDCPRKAEDGRKLPQVAPKTIPNAPRLAKDGPRMRPGWPWDGPKTVPGWPRIAKNGARMIAQDGPSMDPGLPQHGSTPGYRQQTAWAVHRQR